MYKVSQQVRLARQDKFDDPEVVLCLGLLQSFISLSFENMHRLSGLCRAHDLDYLGCLVYIGKTENFLSSLLSLLAVLKIALNIAQLPSDASYDSNYSMLHHIQCAIFFNAGQGMSEGRTCLCLNVKSPRLAQLH